MTNSEIKVGFLISYDYEYLKNSLPLVYEHVSYIAIAIDKKRLTWSGNSFDIPDAFFDWLNAFDTDKKIQIYEDDFYVPELSPLECDTRERTMLGAFMGKGGWHVQIDTDEYFLDFKAFKDYLIKYIDYDVKTLVQVPVHTIFKQDDNGSFLVVDNTEYFPLATNYPEYERARYPKEYSSHVISTPILHQSWGKELEQIKKKIYNWGHKNDFDTDAYLKLWLFIDSFTYKYIKNFHPIYPEMWGCLEFIPEISIPELIIVMKEHENHKKEENNLKKCLCIHDFVPPICFKILKAIKRKLNKIK